MEQQKRKENSDTESTGTITAIIIVVIGLVAIVIVVIVVRRNKRGKLFFQKDRNTLPDKISADNNAENLIAEEFCPLKSVVS